MKSTLLNIATLCLAFAVIALLHGCTITDGSVTTSASNYVRLSEYAVGYRVYGSLTGCQLSTEGEVVGQWTLVTENCEASSE